LEGMTRLAHIDRPTGARASLYPTISNLRCYMCWESSSNILVGWGDCLMSLQIKEQLVAGGSGGTVAAGAAGPSIERRNSLTLSTDVNAAVPSAPVTAATQRKRTVECVMAWELDCVACGVAPMDADHVVVLGLVPPELNSDDAALEGQSIDDDNETNITMAELQIVSRREGTIASSDALPLLYPLRRSSDKRLAASELNLLSSYTTPRRDNRTELSDRILAGQSGELPSFAYNPSRRSIKESQLEMYQKWSIDRVMCTSDVFCRDLSGTIPTVSTTVKAGRGALPQPPVMVVCCPFDVILVNARDVDDAIAHARSQGDARLALLRGWTNQPLMRKYSLNFLINEYLLSLIRQNTLSSLKLAAFSCDILLRGDVEMWEKWICVFAKLSGGLFALREHVPVRGEFLDCFFHCFPRPVFFDLMHLVCDSSMANSRPRNFSDPKLGSTFYELMLEKMCVEVEGLFRNAASVSEDTVSTQAKELYLTALLAWGPTSAIRERIRLIRWRHPGTALEKGKRSNAYLSCEQLAWELYRRKHQSASDKAAEEEHILIDILSGGKDGEVVRDTSPKDQRFIAAGLEYASTGKWSNEEAGLPYSLDSLYNMARVASRLVPRLTMLEPPCDGELPKGEEVVRSGRAVNIAAEALAELHFMRGEYDEALKLYLIKGANNQSKLDNEALLAAQKKLSKKSFSDAGTVGELRRFEFVLAMIEHHNLFSCLLDGNFLHVIGVKTNSSRKSRDPQVPSGEVPASHALSPIVALIHLVGLELASTFLVENCVNADSTTSYELLHNAAHANLPLYDVASQLSGRPKLLYWYLQQIFLQRPEIYVGLSHMAVPPKEILDLHRSHLELHVKYHDLKPPPSSSASSCGKAGDTPLMEFLRVSGVLMTPLCCNVPPVLVSHEFCSFNFGIVFMILGNTGNSTVRKCTTTVRA